MIDLGLSKIALIALVALLVVGPERLPKLARMVGTLFGRAQRYVNEVKSEVSRSIELEELRKLQKDMQDAASDVEQTFTQNVAQVHGDLNATWSDGIGEKFAEGPPAPLPQWAQPAPHGVTPERVAAKAKDFRKKRLSHISAVPSWYKRQSGVRTRVVSDAAHLARQGHSRAAANFFIGFHD
jgi:sec-independent protein translocase protein TatB